MYSAQVSLILIAMILTGAIRSVAVKVFFQLGLETPYFVTILSSFAGLLAFGVYYIHRCWLKRRVGHPDVSSEHEIEVPERCPSRETQERDLHPPIPSGEVTPNQSSWPPVRSNDKRIESILRRPSTIHSQTSGQQTDSSAHDESQSKRRVTIGEKSCHDEAIVEDIDQGCISAATSIHRSISHQQSSSAALGSETGLTEASHRAAAHILQSIPWYWQFILIGFLDFVSYLFRWGSILLIRTSIAEMLSNGVEMVLSVVAARVIRKRQIAKLRWVGVWVVILGMLIVGAVDLLTTSSDDDGTTSSGTGDKVLGIFLILGAGVFATALTLAEEILTQEAKYPVLIVMGNEGLWGLLLGVALYFPVAPLLKEDPSETWEELVSSPSRTWYAVGLVCFFTLAAMLNVLSIAVTSSMTQYVWIHLRSIPVWIIGLTIYYVDDSNDSGSKLGEPWLIPQSLAVLIGFGVMLTGVYIYYCKEMHGSPSRHSISQEEA